MVDRVIIIGSGSSVRQNQWDTSINDLPIWGALKNEVTIGINWAYKWIIPTIELFADYRFYHTQFEEIKNLPFLITINDGYYKREGHQKILDTLYFLKRCRGKKYLKAGDLEESIHPYYWGKDSWKQGWYTTQLSGILALTFAINALKAKEIWLLGYDCKELNGHTHFYDDTDVGKHSMDGQFYYGVGKDKRGYYRTGNYNNLQELNDFWFKPFQQELMRDIKIYNVSPDSGLNVFPKLSYNYFLYYLNKVTKPINQDKIRTQIKNLINANTN